MVGGRAGLHRGGGERTLGNRQASHGLDLVAVDRTLILETSESTCWMGECVCGCECLMPLRPSPEVQMLLLVTKHSKGPAM